MSDSSYINVVNNYSVDEFVQFLKINELSEFENIVVQKNIDGHTFLNLAEFEINNWRPFLNTYQSQKFWSFLNQLHQNPENFTYSHQLKPVIPAKPSISRSRLENLSQNVPFLESLRNAVQSRICVQQHREEDQKPLTQNQNRKDRREIAPPPRPPIFKRPVVRPPNDPNSESEEDGDDEAIIYETPDDQEEETPNNTQFAVKAQKPLPQLPQAFSQQLNLYDDPDKPKPQGVSEEQPAQRKLFRLQQHYAKQREKERELAAQAQQSVISKAKIQHNPLPPVPNKDVSPRVKRTAERGSTLPRPPIILPRVDVALPDSPDPPTQKPMEQEIYYRYTDRKGAEQLLSEPFGDGTYLVRPSRSFHSTLSVKQENKVYHIGIKKVDGQMLEMVSSGLNLKFNTLNEIIDYFKYKPLSVRNKQNEIIDIYLDKTLPADRT